MVIVDVSAHDLAEQKRILRERPLLRIGVAVAIVVKVAAMVAQSDNAELSSSVAAVEIAAINRPGESGCG